MPLVFTWITWLTPASVTHRRPSGPVTMPLGNHVVVRAVGRMVIAGEAPVLIVPSLAAVVIVK